MSDGSSGNGRSSGGGGGVLRPLRPLAVAAATAAAVAGGQKLLERRRSGRGGEVAGGAGRASVDEGSADAADRPADLGAELRGAASDLALTLLDRAAERLEQAKP